MRHASGTTRGAWWRTGIPAALLGLSVLIPASARTEVPSLGGDALWQGLGTTPGFSSFPGGDISYLVGAVEFENELVVTGSFGSVDGVLSHNVVRWDGRRWKTFGGPLAGSHHAPMVFRDELIAVGSLYQASADGENLAYRWTGETWGAFGPESLMDPNTQVESVVVYQGGLVIYGFRFVLDPGPQSYPAFLLRWDGARWTDLPLPSAALAEGRVGFPGNAIAVFQDALYMAGRLDSESSGDGLARWNGSNWEHVDTGMDGSIHALAVYKNRLVLGGRFTRVGGIDAMGIAAWDGATWSALGEGLGDSSSSVYVGSMFPLPMGLAVQGQFDHAGSEPADDLALWDGTTWLGMSANPPALVRSLAAVHDTVLAVADTYAGPYRSPGLVAWDGSAWVPYPDRGVELIDAPRATLPAGDELLVAARFRLAGSLEWRNGVGAWNGSRWRLMAAVERDPVEDEFDVDVGISDMTRLQGKLLVAGAFDRINGVEAHNIAVWNGTAWEPLGAGTNGPVHTVLTGDGYVAAGGEFTEAGGRPAAHVAAWDGGSWHAIGEGFDPLALAVVFDLEVYNGELIACGYFHGSSGFPVYGVARWSSVRWSDVGDPVIEYRGNTPILRQLVPWNGKLVATGRFDMVNGIPATGLAAWDGRRWEVLAADVLAEPLRIAEYRGYLVVSGSFDLEEDDQSETELLPSEGTMLLFDGTNWFRPGSAVWYGGLEDHHSVAPAVLTTWGDRLIAGGWFEAAGTAQAHNLAAWSGQDTRPLGRNIVLGVAPNPATVEGRVVFHLEEPGPAGLLVFDIAGRLVRTLADGSFPGGDQRFTWDLLDTQGRRVPGGVYFLRVVTPRGEATRRLVVLP